MHVHETLTLPIRLNVQVLAGLAPPPWPDRARASRGELPALLLLVPAAAGLDQVRRRPYHRGVSGLCCHTLLCQR